MEGTCTWTIESAQYKSWLAATKSSVLWITGAAGTGKTTLANFLAEQLEQCYPSRDAGLTDYIVCSFFCSRGIEGRHDVLSLLRDLILQLAQPRKKIIRMIKSMYGTGKQESDLSIYRAWQMFGTVLSTLTCQSLFIVIDALDECDNSSRVQLLKRLASTVSSVTTKSPAACKVIKIIFTGQPQIRTSWSRTSKDVEHYQIDIDDRSTGISHDLDLFIEVRVDELVTENSYSSDVGQDLKATLKSMAETSFLWLDTILKHIQQSLAYKLDDVKSLLANVPDDLYQAYTKYLPPLPSNDQTTLQRYLQLLVACSRPLQLAEIDILIESDHETATRMLAAGSANSNVVRASMQRALGPLVRFPRNTAQLCHSTARDFFLAISQQPENPLFQSHGVDMGSAHFLCAKLCMSYLLHPSLPSDMFSKHICDSTSIDAASPTSDHSQSEDQDFLTNMFDIEDVAFLRDADVLESETCAVINQQCEAFDYAALNWTYHMKKLGKRLDGHLTTMALSLMTGEKGRASDWYRYQKHRSCLQMPAQEAINAIVLAATYDLDDLLEALFNDSSFQYHEEWLSEALFWASSRGCQDAVKVLLSFGAPVKSVRIHQVPLAVTAQGGYLDICSLLLESTDIDPNESNSRGKSPLMIAAEANHVGILRLVLKHKNILADKVDGDGRTAFIAACRSGSLESVQVLCEDNRIDINMVDIKGQTALHHASHFGHSLVVRKLLKIPDLDKSTVDLTGRNAISLASQHGHLDVVKLLIKHGIDPATRDKTGRNSISWAANSVKATVAESGQESVLKYLLRKAPHASDVPDCDGWTPLAWAMDPPGYVEAVEALLGIPYVDINRRDDDGLCTLAWAAASGMTEIVKRFLQSPNVDVNAASHRGTTPLMIAASEGKTAVVEVLLQCSQIDIDLKDEFGRTALDRATFTSHVDIVEMLQKYGQSQS